MSATSLLPRAFPPVVSPGLKSCHAHSVSAPPFYPICFQGSRDRKAAVLCRGGNNEDTGSAWSRLSLAKRQLGLAVAEEDFALCVQLKAEVAALEDRLPPQKQLLLVLLDKLHGDERERVTAAQALGDLGDAAALPALQASLLDDEIGGICEASMWSIFMTTPSEEVGELMARGMVAMHRPADWDMAVAIFTDMSDNFPEFAEGFNKRGTLLYLMQRYHEAIEDCRVVLQLNPFHFGAATGMGMCCAAVKDYSGAIAAFERALALNPRLGHLQYHILQLQRHGQ